MSCSICKSAASIPLFTHTVESSEWIIEGVNYGYQQCTHCKFIQCHPIPSAASLSVYYQEQYAYDWFQKNSFYKKWQAVHRYFKVKSFIQPTDKILDFGCGHGYFVQALTKRNFQCYGFDIGSDKISHHQNGHITNKTSLHEYKEEGFDLITLWHVLEHMQDHHAIINQLKQKLTPTGKIIIAVPNTNSYAFKQLGTKWGWLQQPYVHINQYNAENLSMLLKEHGFVVEKIATTDTWDQSLYDYFISKLFYQNKSRNTVRKFGENTGGNMFFRLNQLVRLFFVPISYLYSLIRKSKLEGNELLIVAHK
jgi:2-polyprenyl-3-methyl-5-hydroxy-6-metoxy-1,4-benzoquinol methylase